MRSAAFCCFCQLLLFHADARPAVAFTAFLPLAISLLDYKIISKLFPPIVIGPVIMLIGIDLIGAGFGDWGGGTFCAQRVIYDGACLLASPPAAFGLVAWLTAASQALATT